ncbi:MAG: sterol desaturase family protein [Saprospiraceae bacterium]|nr:sterol desaturase family protein [Saprospiraceae bacterium]
MEAIADYFANIPSSHRSVILLGGLTFFLLLESGLPYYRKPYKKAAHLGINLFFTHTTVLVNFLMAFLLLRTADWVVTEQIGLLQWLPEMPMWAFFLLGLMLLDLVGAYFIHWMEHRVRWMWRFHLVHHTDTNVDTSTANRHHPGESVFRFVFTVLGIILVGAPIGLVLMYQSLSVVFTQFSHANIQFPKWLDTGLSWLIVTPSMHRVHHHYVLPYTDTNFGNIFSVWDRLFGTYAKVDNDQLVFGIDTHPDPKEHSNVWELLKMPFLKYRSPAGGKFGENLPRN